MSKHSRSKTVWRVILAIVSVLVIVALATVAVIYRPTWIHADSPVTQRSSVSRTVSPPAETRAMIFRLMASLSGRLF